MLALAAGGVFALMVLCAISGLASACAECLRAGAASAALRVPSGTPLAGYGSVRRRLLVPDIFGQHGHAFWFKPHIGELDPLMARALVLESGSSHLMWVSLDVVGVDRAFTQDLGRRLGAGSGPGATLIVSASHTHSGPGAFIDSAVMGFIAVDRRDDAVRNALLDAAVSAVRRANTDRRTARVGAASIPAPGHTTGRLGRSVDSEMIVMKIVTQTGAPIAVLWNYAIHGTTLGARNLHLSGDVMGLASRLAEAELSVPVLFVNGAVADVSPRRHGHEGTIATSHELAATLRTGWNHAEPHGRAALRIRKTTIRLAAPRLSLRNCLGRWMPGGLAVHLDSVFPRDAELIAAAVGPVAWVTIPGELQAALGQVVKRSAARYWRHVFIAGLSNDYLGYFVTAQDYDRSSYVTCANLYGAAAGDDLARAASELLVELDGHRAASHVRLPGHASRKHHADARHSGSSR